MKREKFDFEQWKDHVYLSCMYGSWKVIDRLCRLLPISPRYIWFESEIDFVENTRALYEYMIREPKYQQYRLIWCVDDPSAYPQRKNTIFLPRKRGGFRYSYYLNRSKFVLLTHPYWLKNWRKGQTVINTCHGNPFKAPRNCLEDCADYVLASSETMETFRRQGFGGKCKMAILGAPRLDWLYGQEDYLSDFTEGRNFCKVIFSMPTFKQSKNWSDSEENASYSINVVSSIEQLHELNAELQQRNVLMVCIIHHLQKMDNVCREKLSNILFLRDEDYGKRGLVMNQMLRSADALLTDYSGVFLDYILLDRPIGFYCNSWQEYKRGFAMEDPENYMPGPRLSTLEDLLQFIDQVIAGEDSYEPMRKQVRDRVHRYQDNQNCRRFLEYFKI